jgi:hypothetical protein
MPPEQVRPAQLIMRAVALVLPVVLALGVFLWQKHEHDQATAARDEDRSVLDAATLASVRFASVDYRKVDDYFSGVKQVARGQFLQQFVAKETQSRSFIVDNKLINVPTIPRNGAGVMERTGDKAKVIVAIDTSESSKQLTAPQTEHSLFQLSLTKQGGKWLVDELGVL